MADRSVGVRTRLAALDLALPEMTPPLAAYVPAKIDEHTGTIYVSGQLPMLEKKLLATGKIGNGDISVEEGKILARQAALNLLAAIDSVADLDEVEILKVEALVASQPDFYEQHIVANAASELLGNALGELGRHARVASATPQLPLNSPIEITATARRLTR